MDNGDIHSDRISEYRDLSPEFRVGKIIKNSILKLFPFGEMSNGQWGYTLRSDIRVQGFESRIQSWKNNNKFHFEVFSLSASDEFLREECTMLLGKGCLQVA
jgi:hypothetical protein